MAFEIGDRVKLRLSKDTMDRLNLVGAPIDNKIVNDPTHDHINHFLNLKNLNIFYFKKLSAYDFLTVFLF